ncbi:MAG: LptF/LptG family permease, partial [Chitinophagales bacterium]
LKPEVRNKQQYEHMRMEFGSWEKLLDLSGFEMQESSEELYKDHYRMMNVSQLQVAIDSLYAQSAQKSASLSKVLDQYFMFNKDTAFILPNSIMLPADSVSHFIDLIQSTDKQQIIKRSLTTVRNISNYTQQIEDSLRFTNNKIAEHKIEWHRKFTFSIICLVFMFVGAPLGAIIRKGGFGLPVIFSIFIFIIFYVINITGEKMADQSVITPFSGMWMAIFIIFPFSLYLTLQAKNDSPVFNRDFYLDLMYRVKKIKIFKLIVSLF